jgi:hypothetical protein
MRPGREADDQQPSRWVAERQNRLAPFLVPVGASLCEPPLRNGRATADTARTPHFLLQTANGAVPALILAQRWATAIGSLI